MVMEGRSWGVELWDQADNLCKHEAEQLALVELYLKVLSEKQKATTDYAKKLKKVFTVYGSKCDASDDFSSKRVYVNILSKFMEMADVHERYATKLSDNVITDLKSRYDEDKKKLEKLRGLLNNCFTQFEQERKALENSWHKYAISFKESRKVRIDKNLTQQEYKKAEACYQNKLACYKRALEDYDNQLVKYNAFVSNFYNKDILHYLDNLQSSNRERLDVVKQSLLSTVDLDSEACDALSKCNLETSEMTKALDSLTDSENVINRFYSGELPPVELPHLLLDNTPVKVLESSQSELGAFLLGIRPSKSCSQLVGLVGGGSPGLGSKFLSSLLNNKDEYKWSTTPFICGIGLKNVKPEELTIVQLAQRLKKVKDMEIIANNEFQATQRMQSTYLDNPALGNAQALESNINKLNRRIFSLRAHINQLEELYTKLGGEAAYLNACSLAESLNSESTCGDGSRRSSYRRADSFDTSDSDDSSNRQPDVDQKSIKNLPDSFPYVGSATVLYPYEGNGSYDLTVQPGETFHVVQLDTDNMGWTLLESQDGTRQGYVPTNYINIKDY